jgi:hypothetical protein
MKKLLLAATALLAIGAANPANAYTIDIIAAFDQSVSFADPAGVTVETYAGPPTGNTFINNAGANARDSYLGVTGTTANSGLFIGNIGGNDTSPFGLANNSRVYLAAGGGGGSVVLTSQIGVQNSLSLLWGTVDSGDFRNRIFTSGGDLITGTNVLAACAAEGFNCTDEHTNVFLRITGLSDFTFAKFSDRDGNSFEFVPLAAAVPEPATWAMMILGFLGIGVLGMRKKLGGVRLA